MAMTAADQALGQSPITRRPARLRPPEARTIASTPTLTAAGSRPHAATTAARSGGTALDFALVLCSTPGVSRVKPGLLESCPC